MSHANVRFMPIACNRGASYNKPAEQPTTYIILGQIIWLRFLRYLIEITARNVGVTYYICICGSRELLGDINDDLQQQQTISYVACVL